MSDVLTQLSQILEQRKQADDGEKSYVASLHQKGLNKILEKVGEEATETIIASLCETKEDLVNESADLIFHLSVLWADKNVTPEDVMAELEKRMGISGLDEKAKRQSKEKGKD